VTEPHSVGVMTDEWLSVGYGVDANGSPTEDFDVAGGSIRLRYEDIPESDITTVDGIRVTTPLRTVIDLAAELDATKLDQMVQTFLDRRLFSVAEAFVRLDEPDMASRPGARVLRAYLRQR
jgi:hypothetical protein